MVNCCEACAARGRVGELLAGWHAAKRDTLWLMSWIVG